MRGPVNTRIKLTIVRIGQDKPIEFTITRELIRVPATVSRDTSADADVSTCSDPRDPADMSKDPKFTEAVAHRVYYGPVYFRRESEPYMTLSLAGTGTSHDAGVSVAEVSLKLVWQVVTAKVGERGVVYVVDSQGRVIAHPVISLALRNMDFSSLPQVKAAREWLAGIGKQLPERAYRGFDSQGIAQAMSGKDINGHDVLVAYTTVRDSSGILGWQVFAEVLVEDADSLAR
jgi:hypothetical protein